MHQTPDKRPDSRDGCIQQRLDAGARKELRASVTDARVLVGRGTYGAPRFVLYSREDRIEIGRYCSIAESTIVGGGEHNYRSTSTFPFHWYHGEDPGPINEDPAKIHYYNAIYKGATRIGCDVWIGFGATILSGVTVGSGAVIGAAAVIASDVPPFAIMVGNPARCLRKRFDESMIERLLQIRWWDWKPEDLYEYQDLLSSSPQEFVAAVDRLPSEELTAMYEANPDAVDRAYQADVQRSGDVEPVNADHEIGMVKSSKFKSIARQITPPILYGALYRLTR